MKQQKIADSKNIEEVGKIVLRDNSIAIVKVIWPEDHDLKNALLVLDGPKGSVSLPLFDSTLFDSIFEVKNG